MIQIIQHQLSLDTYFNDILLFNQEEKFYALSRFLTNNQFNFEKNEIISQVFEIVFNFLNDRSKWKDLYIAQTDLLKNNIKNKIMITEQSKRDSFAKVSSVRGKNSNEDIILATNENKKVEEYSKSIIKESDELIVMYRINRSLF